MWFLPMKIDSRTILSFTLKQRSKGLPNMQSYQFQRIVCVGQGKGKGPFFVATASPSIQLSLFSVKKFGKNSVPS